MKNNFKVIVSDIDCTITRTDHTISKRTLDTISKIREAGYLFGLASGRPIDDLLRRYEEWGLKDQFDFIIAWNGCQLYDNDTKEIYKYNYLTKDELKEIIEFMSQFDISVNIYKPNKYVTNKESNRAWYSAFRNKRELVIEEDLSKYYDEESGGIMFRTTLEDMPRIEEVTKEFVKDKNYIGFKTQNDLMEFSNKDCSKGYVLKKYLELKNIPAEQCLAIGDTSNDNDLLSTCYGVCMENGSADTKALAKEITEFGCDEDGFADYMEKHLL